MGITIAYQGNLDDPARWPVLSDELKLAANRLGWPYQEVDERILGQTYVYRGTSIKDGMGRVYSELVPIDDRIRGAHLQPPETEALVITVDRTGQLMQYLALPGPIRQTTVGGGLPVTTFGEESGFYYKYAQLWVKTTGAIESHIRICELLRDLQKKYISDLKVKDDTNFFHNGDEGQLRREHKLMGGFVGLFNSPSGGKALTNMAGLDAEDAEPVDPNIESTPPDWTKDRGISAGDN